MPRSILAAALLLSAAPAQAVVVFNVDADLRDTAVGTPLRGKLTGTFTTTDDLTTITTYDLTAAASGPFAGYRYTTSNSTVTASVLPSQFFQIDSPGSANELRLFFSSPLARAGTTFNSVASYEFETSGGLRSVNGTVTAQAVSAVPEPAAWAMMIGGIGIAGGSLRRRRKVTTRAALV